MSGVEALPKILKIKCSEHSFVKTKIEISDTRIQYKWIEFLVEVKYSKFLFF